MPKKEMLQIEIGTNKDGYITLQQENFGTDDAVIIIHASQVDTLIKWLKEAKSELNKNKP